MKFSNTSFKVSFSILIMLLLISCASKLSSEKKSNSNWDQLNTIFKDVQPPVFPNKTFNVMDYGAISDGVFDNSDVFNKTIKTCSEQGGGLVLIPKGTYFTGPIHLDNNVNLHLNEGAEIVFSTNPKDYPLVHTSFEGTELMNYSPLIYAYNKTNVAVTGKGILNGKASKDNWWPWCGKSVYGWKKGDPIQNVKQLMESAEKGMAVKDRVFGDGNYLRPNFMEFFECKNVHLKDFKIVNAPFWIIHPIKSNHVIVDGIHIESHGPNNDGCDPEYSKNVIIRNCTFDTGDDCIAIKAGRDSDGRRVAIKSENILIQNCKMFDGHGGVTIGSEISAGVSNVFVENCIMDSPELDRAIRIKSNTRRGGLIENIYVRNITVGEVKESVLGIDLHYGVHGNQTGTFMPIVRNIFIENSTIKNGGLYGILAKGHPGFPISNIRFKEVTIEKVETDYAIENVENLKFINTYINGSLMESPKKQ
ncbi:glycoside hydrolase family 28 protein [Flavobacterium branchiophilum]|uniref:Glycoside hydrolase n=1 Tax=Flavobacterium branchiophilum TaxID=55197 RepID=A0A2H3KYP5_9FLAO|nr:glycoside hydrolase family 28 protein [Flavobacterium branchiophilum]PDS26624.1 glycoside hydrolase [Flavobacterium branchiophilum]